MSSSSAQRIARQNGWRAVVALGLLLLPAGALLTSAVATARLVPSITVQGERTPQGVKLALRGAGWPERVAVSLSASTPPGGAAPLDLGTAMTSAAGEFRATKLTPCTTADSAAAERVTVTVTARTADGTAQAEAKLVAAPWACLPR
jgi:hypothetical protein